MFFKLSLLPCVALLCHTVLAARPYSSWMADSVISRQEGRGVDSSGNAFITYEHGVFQRSLESLYNKTSNATYLSYMQQGIDKVVTSTGSLNDYSLTYYTLDDIRLGEGFIYL